MNENRIEKGKSSPFIRSGSQWTLGLLVGVFWYSPVVKAQQPPAPSPVTPAVSGVPSKAVVHDSLSDDPRLDAKVTLTRREITVEQCLHTLAQQTNINLTVGSSEIPHKLVAVVVKDEPLRDVMRSLALLYNFQWDRGSTPKGEALWILNSPSDPHRWDFLRPHDEAEAKENQSIRDFADQISHLSPEAQQALSDGGEGVLLDGKGVPFTALSPEMQQNVQNVVEAELDRWAVQHLPISMTTGDVNESRVAFGVRPNGAITDLQLHVFGNNHGSITKRAFSPE